MQNTISNPCIRCGKERINGKTWNDHIGANNNLIVYTLTICPDKACQKIVDQEIAERQANKLQIEQTKIQSKLEKSFTSLVKL